VLTTQTTTIIVAIGALVVPPVVSFIKHATWSAQIKQLIAAAASVAVSAVGLLVTAPHDFGMPFAELSGLIYTGTQAVYGIYFKNSSLDNVLTALFYKKSTTTTVTTTAKGTTVKTS
jgi:hypothetical protein